MENITGMSRTVKYLTKSSVIVRERADAVPLQQKAWMMRIFGDDRECFPPKVWGLILIFAVILLVGCSDYNEQRGRGDAPVGNRDDSPANIVNMPDHFANVSHKCYGPNGIYESTREAPPVVIVNDPNCDPKGELLGR